MPPSPRRPGIATHADLFPRPREVRRRTGVCPIAKLQRPRVVEWDDASNPIRAGILHRLISGGTPSQFDHRTGEQAFVVSIRPGGATIMPGGAPGLRYARQCLEQLRSAGTRLVQCMDLADWPDFAVRGVMLDISRCKVPTMATLRGLVDLFAAWRINQLQLYMEHTFAYRGHEKVWRGASPMTGREIEALDKWCRDRGIELVPNQNSFGHMERWLKHAPYRRLAETTKPWNTPFGTVRSWATTLCPSDPGSIALIRDLYDQLLPHFSSRLLNVGCDETFELGQGRSRAACARRGRGSVYVDYLRKLRREARRRGRRMMFWSDIVHEHREVIAHVPREAIALVWGYEDDHPFDRQCAELKRRGLEFYVCPGTSSWCSFAGRTTNALENLRNAARAGRRHGATGYLMTDWGDYGHRQYLPVSLGPLLYGAGVSWCAAAHESLDVGEVLDRLALRDADGRSGRWWLEAGRIHEASGVFIKNRSVLFNMMESPIADIRRMKGLTPARISAMEREVNRLLRACAGLRAASLLSRELRATLAVLGHACRRGRLAFMPEGAARRREAAALAKDMREIIAQHRTLWRARNRPGGLRESTAYYESVLREYQTLLSTKPR